MPIDATLGADGYEVEPLVDNSAGLPSGGEALQVLGLDADLAPTWFDAPPAEVADGTITSAKLAPVTTKTVLGRSSSGTGAVEQVPVTTLKTDLSLGNVNNTADSAKPVSTAQQTALDGKLDIHGAVALGTGNATVTEAANADRQNTWTGTSGANITAGTGTTEGAIIAITNNGTADLTLVNVTIGTGYSDTIAAGALGLIQYTAGAWKSRVAATSTGTAPEVVDVAFSATVPLDTVDPGKQMAEHTMTANVTFTLGASPVDGGTCKAMLIGGTGGEFAADFSAFTDIGNSVQDWSEGARNLVVWGREYGDSIYFSRVTEAGTPAVTGILSQTTFTPGGTLNLTTIGTTDWLQRRDATPDRKTGSGFALVDSRFGAGSSNYATSPVAYTSTNSDTSNRTSDTQTLYKVLDSSGGGFQEVLDIGTTEQIVDLRYDVGVSTTSTLTLTLSDGAATLGAVTLPAGDNQGRRIHVRAASAGQTLTIRFAGTDPGNTGTHYIAFGSAVVYAA